MSYLRYPDVTPGGREGSTPYADDHRVPQQPAPQRAPAEHVSGAAAGLPFGGTVQLEHYDEEQIAELTMLIAWEKGGSQVPSFWVITLYDK